MVRKSLLVMSLLCLALGLVACKQNPPAPMPPQLTAEQHFNQGLSFYQQENFSDAAFQFEQAVAKRANYVEAYDYLGRSYWKQNMLSRAEQAFVKAVQLQPSYLPAREYLGLLYYVMNNLSLAKQQLEAARGLNSIDPAVYTALGEIYLQQGSCKSAITAFKRALQLNSSYIEAKQGLDRATSKCGGKKSTSKPKPKPTPKTQFKGGAKALDPADF